MFRVLVQQFNSDVLAVCWKSLHLINHQENLEKNSMRSYFLFPSGICGTPSVIKEYLGLGVVPLRHVQQTVSTFYHGINLDRKGIDSNIPPWPDNPLSTSMSKGFHPPLCCRFSLYGARDAATCWDNRKFGWNLAQIDIIDETLCSKLFLSPVWIPYCLSKVV